MPVPPVILELAKVLLLEPLSTWTTLVEGADTLKMENTLLELVVVREIPTLDGTDAEKLENELEFDDEKRLMPRPAEGIAVKLLKVLKEL